MLFTVFIDACVSVLISFMLITLFEKIFKFIFVSLQKHINNGG